MTLIEEFRNAYEILVENLEGKKVLVRPKHGWEKITLKMIVEKYGMTM
jgi:hypothetical protein